MQYDIAYAYCLFCGFIKQLKQDIMKMYTLKDFELSLNLSAIERANEFQKYIDQLNNFGYKSYWIEAYSSIGASMHIEPNNKVVAFVSNDYLGMSQNPETIEAGINAIKKYGTGACAAPVIGGYLDIHKELENKIADFVGQEDAILFSSGFGANAGLLRALLGKNDIAIIDAYIHASAISGLQGTNVKCLPHNNLECLEIALKNESPKYKTKLVIIDGVYSQGGDLAKLPEIISICHKYGALIMLDDAHGIGVFGTNGRGTAEHFNCLGQVDIITGTFSKSFGCVGGFIATSKMLTQYLRYYADSNIFSASIAPQATASVLKALELIKSRPEIRSKLWSNVNYLRDKLTEFNIDTGVSVSPIFPIMISDNKKVYEIAKLLQEKGIFTNGIVYPAVRIKEPRLRVSILASHTKEQIDKLINALCEINATIGLK